MKIGMVGLGRMGMNMALRLIEGKHKVVGYDPNEKLVKEFEKAGGIGAYSLKEIADKLERPRIVWMMVPAGGPVEQNIVELSRLLWKTDIIIDGGNSNYKDAIRRARILDNMSMHFVDAGVSGGLWGRENGYCIMVGGEKDSFRKIEPILKTLATDGGYMYCGPAGAGHFAKMVHNGIEYALMEAYGEGFEILKASNYSAYFKLPEIAALWNKGSVIRSWLLELVESALRRDSDLSKIEGFVDDTGEGRWAVEQAVESGVSAPAIATSLFKRFQSRQDDIFSDKLVAALRNEFGGHAVIKIAEKAKERARAAKKPKVTIVKKTRAAAKMLSRKPRS